MGTFTQWRIFRCFSPDAERVRCAPDDGCALRNTHPFVTCTFLFSSAWGWKRSLSATVQVLCRAWHRSGMRVLWLGFAPIALLAQSEFIQTIQPVLVENCAACHKPGSAKGPASFLTTEIEANRGLWRNVA